MAELEVGVDLSDLKLLHSELAKTSNEMRLLEQSTNPAYNAFSTFQKKVDILNREFREGNITSARYGKSLNNLRLQAERAGVSMDKMGNIAVVNTRRFRRFGAVGMQQVGYQVQDFAVQVQGGTSALVALGQQGSQLVSVIPHWAGAIDCWYGPCHWYWPCWCLYCC